MKDGEAWFESQKIEVGSGLYAGSVMAYITVPDAFGNRGVKLVDTIYGDKAYFQLNRDNDVTRIKTSDTHGLEYAAEGINAFFDSVERFQDALDELIADECLTQAILRRRLDPS